VFELRRIAGCCEPAVLDGISRSFSTAEHTTCYEVKQPVTAREPRIEYCRVFLHIARNSDVLAHVGPQALTRMKGWTASASFSLCQVFQAAASSRAYFSWRGTHHWEGFSGCVVFAQWAPLRLKFSGDILNRNARKLHGHSLLRVRETVVSMWQIGPYRKQTRRLSRCERYRGIIGIQSQENWSIYRQLDV
jgi:hypothetical protein